MPDESLVRVKVTFYLIHAQHLALWCQMRKQWSTSDRWEPLTSGRDPSTPGATCLSFPDQNA